MTDPNQHIRDELEHFRNMPGRAYYALQINAPWGAGKSHFITNYLKNISPESTYEDGPLSIKVTLFGAQSVKDLEDQVVAQIFSKSDRVVGTIFSGLVSGAAKHLHAEKLADSVVDAAQQGSLKNRLQRVRGGDDHI